MHGQQQHSPLLNEIIRRLVNTGHPRRIVLFGSRARGTGHPHSDHDLLIIADSTEPNYKRPVPYYLALSDLPAHVDIVVYTPEEVESSRSTAYSLVTTALREGVTLYEQAA